MAAVSFPSNDYTYDMARYWRSWRVPPREPLSVWADRERVLSSESNPTGGRWKTSTVPYTREPMDCLTDLQHEKVILVWPTQAAKTEIAMNFVGYIHRVDPGPILYAMETEQKAKAIVRDRYLPMLRDTPCLREFRKEHRRGERRTKYEETDSHETLHHTFPGGHFTAAGAHSPGTFSTRPIRYFLGDEVDEWPTSTGKAGDPVTLGERRTQWFWNKKIVLFTSPRDDETSIIKREYVRSDQRHCYLPCLTCGTYQELTKEALRYELDEREQVIPDTVGFECQGCNRLIPESERQQMLEACEWRATYPERTKIAGFWLWAAYCPPVSWLELVEEDLRTVNDPEARKAYVNTRLAETWKPYKEEEGEVTAHTLLLSAENRQMGDVPAEVQMLTAGVDVQKNRCEVSVYGWGAGEEAWLIGHEIVWGRIEDESTQADLDKILGRSWGEPSRLLYLAKVCIDTGYKADEVYDYARQRTNVLATKGMAKANAPAVGVPRKQEVIIRDKVIASGIDLWPLGTHYLKEALWTRLQKRGKRGAKTFHFPAGLSEEFYLQLLSERYFGGEWKKIRVRNETWDCLVLAYAAAIVAQVRALTAQPTQPVALQTQAVPLTAPQRLIPAGTMGRLLRR